MSDSKPVGDSVYRMLFKCSGDAIFVHDEGRILAVNTRACEHLGYEETELLAMKPSDVDTPDESVNMPGRIDSLKSRKTMSFDTVHQRKDGSPVPVEVSAVLIEWGGRQAVMSTCRDMTGKKKAENILLATALEWQSTFDSLKDSIFLLDSEQKILRCNKAASEMFRKKDGEIIGRHCWEVVHGSKEPIPACPIDRMMKSRKREMLEISSGDSWLEITVEPVFDEECDICAAVHIISNITERKRFEMEKAALEIQNRQLQKTQSLDRMAGAISHNFNNKLNVVMGYLEMVIRDLPPGDSHIEELATAMQAAKKASNVSSLMITYLGQKQVKLEVIDIAELCRISLPILQEGKPLKVGLELDLPSPGPVIKADVKQIQQLLANLVINAWESIGDRAESMECRHPGGIGGEGKEKEICQQVAGGPVRGNAGTIRLSVKTVSPKDIPSSHRFPVDWNVNGHSYACLEVIDSGYGIKKADFDRLFEPFFSTKFTGRGLGLPVVLGIVKSHKGVITVENRIGGGTVFSVFFPLPAHMAPPQIEQVAEAPNIATGGTVLLVEDEECVRKMTAVMLDSFGFTVLQAKDGIEAVEIFRQRKDEISCLLSDLTMPRMGGWETIDALRAIRHDLPVILASGYDEASVMVGDHSELPDFFLNKPYAIKKLGDTVCHAIARKAMAGKKTEGKF